MGCPFRIRHRYDELTEQVAFFVRGYRKAEVPLDFVFGDWEVDGPLEVNRAWEAARRCRVCRDNIARIDDFSAFQKAVRIERSKATKDCYTNPILREYPQALVGNYGVYPHDGYRYWYDYFEEFVDYHPHITDQRARYRKWYDDFPSTGYTLAMPVVYPWARGYLWTTFPLRTIAGSTTCCGWPPTRVLTRLTRYPSCRSFILSQSTSQIPETIPFVHWAKRLTGKCCGTCCCGGPIRISCGAEWPARRARSAFTRSVGGVAGVLPVVGKGASDSV